jgi:aromatic-L-amino-acid decarboxylase
VGAGLGLAATAGARRRVEAADSWATDGHKWLNVPYDSGIAIVADRDAHRASMSMSTRAAYLAHGNGDERDPVDWTPEFSRGPGASHCMRRCVRWAGPA